MSKGGERRVSRRGLFGVFGAGAKHFRDALENSARTIGPGSPAQPSAPRPAFERRLRPAGDTVAATPDGQRGFLADLRRHPLTEGRSLRITATGLAEPLMAVRVNSEHIAVVGGECPVDGSDLIYVQWEDRAACPSCGSRWRLDGELTRGPADSRIAAFLTDLVADVLRFRAV